jgi:hypothetical protein
LDKSKLNALELPTEAFRPILPSARHLNTDEVLSDDQGRPILTPELYLLDCPFPEHEVKMRFPQVWEYLQTGKDSVANRYLCKSRKCWYYQERRDAPLFLCPYMGRGQKRTKQPFRFILNHSNATVTNCYLALYPKGALKVFLQKHPEMLKAVWEHLNGIDPQHFVDEGRVYGGGLRKVEPAELMSVPAPELASLIEKHGSCNEDAYEGTQIRML